MIINGPLSEKQLKIKIIYRKGDEKRPKRLVLILKRDGFMRTYTCKST